MCIWFALFCTKVKLMAHLIIKSTVWRPWPSSSVGERVIPIRQGRGLHPQSGDIQESTNECKTRWNNKSMCLSKKRTNKWIQHEFPPFMNGEQVKKYQVPCLSPHIWNAVGWRGEPRTVNLQSLGLSHESSTTGWCCPSPQSLDSVTQPGLKEKQLVPPRSRVPALSAPWFTKCICQNTPVRHLLLNQSRISEAGFLWCLHRNFRPRRTEHRQLALSIYGQWNVIPHTWQALLHYAHPHPHHQVSF